MAAADARVTQDDAAAAAPPEGDLALAEIDPPLLVFEEPALIAPARHHLHDRSAARSVRGLKIIESRLQL